MNIKQSLVTGLALGGFVFVSVTAHSAQLYNNWLYAIDSQNDGSGGGVYEYRGLAYRINGNQVTFAVSGGMPLGGTPVGNTINGRISHGDLFLNFSTHNLDTVAEFNDPKVFGVRFDATNDSLGNIAGSNSTLGVYGSVTPVSLTVQNTGYATLQDYSNAGFGRTSAAMGDLQSTGGDVTAYFGNGTMYPNIGSGTRLGGITSLNKAALTAQDLDFGHFGADPTGNNVYGFSLDRALLPTGDFTGSLFVECINDGVAVRGVNVPEPGAYALFGSGMAAFGGLLLRRRRSLRAR